MDGFDFSTAVQESLLSEVKSHPWAYFRVPQALRTKEMAVLAWDMVSSVLSRMDVEASPTDHLVSEEDWKQFLELLGGCYLYYNFLSEKRRSWKEVVSAIDEFIANQNMPNVSVPFPTIEWPA